MTVNDFNKLRQLAASPFRAGARDGCRDGVCAPNAPPGAVFSASIYPAISYVDRLRRGGGGRCVKVYSLVYPEIRRVVRVVS